MVHLVLTGYPAEGTEVWFVFYDKTPQSPYASDTVSLKVPPGTAPFVYNHTCTVCYTIKATKLGVVMNYVDDASTAWTATQDATIGVGVLGYSTDAPDFSARMQGLTVGQPYYIVAACSTQTYFQRVDFVASRETPTVFWNVLEYPCNGTFYVTVSSVDNVYVGVWSL